jgi:hypothetical protein
MAGPKKEMSWGTFFIVVFIFAAMGGNLDGCDASGMGGGGNNPAPKHSAVCNEHFKGGC